MFEWLSSLHPITQAAIGTGFTYFITAVGAAFVFFFRDVNRRVMDLMLGFGAGVMVAASFWSLLSPAIDLSEQLGRSAWFFPAIGFICGGIFVMLSDALIVRATRHRFADRDESNSLRRSILLIAAVTMHNIPEGLSVGVAFGSAAMGVPGATAAGAALIAIGIGLQNFPEGACVSIPLRREGFSRGKSFFYGQASGMVEPIAGLLGVIAAITMQQVLPFLLSFSAGAMVAVVVAELIPESAQNNKRLCTIGVIAGFVLMMILDIALSA